MNLKIKDPDSRVRVSEMPPVPRTGGETRPYEYPHLYQIQAGDWRISYAVEQNHLAILVLEVLNPDGTVKKDPEHETLTRKMKVKLLDWPEGSPSRDLPPEDLGKKVKIKLLDLAETMGEDDGSLHGSRVRIVDARPMSTQTRRITLLDSGDEDAASRTGTEKPDSETSRGRRVTPLDSPTM